MEKNWIEITTQIGCKNMCTYCPQKTLLDSYTDAKRKMSLEDFKMFLSKIDKNKTRIHFSGFSEAFLNSESVDMMIYAYQNQFDVVLYSTLVGFTEEIAKKLSKMTFYQTRLHEFSSPSFNVSEFYSNVCIFNNNINSLDRKVIKVDYLMSRGGNLFDTIPKVGKINCRENRFFNNVLLPNGDLVLCCSDWGLKHKIGNLYQHHYSSEEFNLKRQEVIKLCQLESSEVICRKCEWSYNG